MKSIFGFSLLANQLVPDIRFGVLAERKSSAQDNKGAILVFVECARSHRARISYI
jgi:hypothetical protein